MSRRMAGDTTGADEKTLADAEGAAKRQDAREPAPTAADARACMPCRGTGKVISNLGGTQSEVGCPWCNGTGIRQPGVDAQEHWRARADTGDHASEQSAAGAA
jgi:DnaJ-class molecular chaperone